MRTLHRAVLTALLCSAFVLNAVAQNQPPLLQEPQTWPLWEQKVPGALGIAPEDTPTITVYMPPNTAGPMTAVIVAPGGGYRALSMNKEGRIPATYLNSLGIAAFVLKYRLGPKYHHPIELGDMQRAIRVVRSRASELHIAPDRVGVMGFSAGGHLAATASTHFDRGDGDRKKCHRSCQQPSRFRDSRLSRDHTLGAMDASRIAEPCCWEKAPTPSWRVASRWKRRVTSETPPTFLFHTNADTAVPVENSIYYFLALRKAGVPAEMHVFKDGAHGAGMPMNDTALSEWPKVLANWMRASGFLR